MLEGVYIRKGERLTTPEGRTVAIAAKDIRYGDTVMPDDFAWVGEPPKVNDPPDEQKGIRWKPGLPDGMLMPQACVEGEWR